MFARAYSSAIRPIALGRRLLGLIDELNHQASIPQSYLINLHADDRQAFQDVEPYLVRELAEAATQHAEQKGYKHDGPISVVLASSDTVIKGTFLISPETAVTQASVLDNSTQQPAQIIEATPQIVNTALVLATGERVLLDGETIKVGRQATCRVAFDDSNVSREHAQLRRGPDGWMILDLGSTNGTKINGLKISAEQLLVNGDEIAFGTSIARFEIS